MLRRTTNFSRVSTSLYHNYKRNFLPNLRDVLQRSSASTDTKTDDLPTKSTTAETSEKAVNTVNFELKDTSEPTSVKAFKSIEIRGELESMKGQLAPSFSKLDQGYIHSHTNYSLFNQLYSPYRWTPLLQKIKPSIEFHERMYQFRKVRGWDESHTRELIDAILYEALKGTDFDYYYDYKCMPSKQCKFHGVADFMIYKKNGNHFPLIPVFIAKKKLDPILNKKLEEYNVCEAVGAAAWNLTNMLAVDKDITHTRILQTTGHTWAMYEFSKDGEFRKTGIYRPNTPGPFKKIYNDPEMQEVILGLVRYASFMHTENEIGLKKAYDFIDEAKYLEELDDDTKNKFEKRRRFWRFLPRAIRDFFFSYR